MSHTSTIDCIAFVDINALRSAINELREKNNIDIELIEGGTPRAYFENQVGMGEAPYVIKLGKCPYDIGLYPREEGKGYVARCDLFAGRVASQVGAPRTGQESEAQASLGKIYNMYAIHAATREAARNGHTVTRRIKEDGTTQLIISLAA